MIIKLTHTQKEIANEIHAIWQASYAVEAKLLHAVDFPPLKRTPSEFLNSTTTFYGIRKNQELAAVTEIESNNNSTHIQSLVVNPKYFRQGLAQQLIAFVFKTYDSGIFHVETGSANAPAIKLYVKFGFKEIKQWDTEHGVRKIRFEKKN